MFTQEDEAQIDRHGLTKSTVLTQIEYFKKGFPPANLDRPATVGDGITRLTSEDTARYVADYQNKMREKVVVKFVPASGAASRMFKSLFAFLEEYKGTESDYNKLTSNTNQGSVFEFLKNLDQFAFHEDLSQLFAKENKSLNEQHVKREYAEIVSKLLQSNGLGYGSLPKGLLKFHKEDSVIKTPVEEHIIEGCQYAKGEDGTVSIHFTVSPEHMDGFKAHVAQVRQNYEKNYDCRLDISYSVQNPGTDTIAVTPENTPFRNLDGTLLFRPAGHGALLENLNGIDADIIFLKNIDNVVPDRLKADTITYKQALAGILVETQERAFSLIENIESTSDAELRDFAKTIGYAPKGQMTSQDWLKVLERPIRVCGMVQNQGDPGGGPFWLADTQGNCSLQIVETAQIDTSKGDQAEILGQATHFNPVDVVCGVKNSKGEKFDLMAYRDPETGFDTEKSKDGKTLKAQELPGLWNGSMAHWNTVFVEVPVSTFNPVKTVNDLLKPQHQGDA